MRGAFHGATVHGACCFAKIAQRIGDGVTSGSQRAAFGREGRAEEPACCFICLENDGEMLVNVCACRWSRAHAKCLEKWMESRPDSNCSVCKQPITHKRDVVQQPICHLWSEMPHVCAFQLAMAFLAIAGGMYAFGLGAHNITSEVREVSDVRPRGGNNAAWEAAGNYSNRVDQRDHVDERDHVEASDHVEAKPESHRSSIAIGEPAELGAQMMLLGAFMCLHGALNARVLLNEGTGVLPQVSISEWIDSTLGRLGRRLGGGLLEILLRWPMRTGTANGRVSPRSASGGAQEV